MDNRTPAGKQGIEAVINWREKKRGRNPPEDTK